MWKHWEKDVAQWVMDCVWTSDPRNLTKGLPVNIPLDPFPKQAEFLRWLEDRSVQRENGIVEKSRDTGVTWLCCSFAVHHWIFRPGFSCAFGSRKQELVDRIGVMDAIFPKMRFIMDYLPDWMLPEGFNKVEHDNYLRIINPATGAEIKGEGGDNMGRGGRSTIYFIDEHATVEHPEMVDAAVSNNSDCVIYVSTPTGGMGTMFAKKRHSGNYKVFTIRWQDDPRKDEEWYKKQCHQYDALTIAQEIDIDYSASLEDVVIPGKWVQAAVGLKMPGSGLRVAGLDVAAGGGNENCYVLRHGPLVLRLNTWREGHSTDTAHKALDLGAADAISALQYDLDGPGDGVAGILDSSERKIPFDYSGVRGGAKPTEIEYSDVPHLKAVERFANFRAEMWWNLRLRFWKTWEHVNGIRNHPIDELISIPNDQVLITQLSLFTYKRTETGKIKIQSKDELKKQGIDSPDRADALVLAFANVKRDQSSGWVNRYMKQVKKGA